MYLPKILRMFVKIARGRCAPRCTPCRAPSTAQEKIEEGPSEPPEPQAPKHLQQQNDKGMAELLECPVCFESCDDDQCYYWLCRRGHILCEDCRFNLTTPVCPLCRDPLPDERLERNECLAFQVKLYSIEIVPCSTENCGHWCTADKLDEHLAMRDCHP